MVASKKCLSCGKSYDNARHKYCSSSCLSAENIKKMNSHAHICPTCGNEFKGQKKQKYCSDKCTRRKNIKITEPGKTEKRCTVCGEWKPLTKEFYFRDKSKYDEFSVICKPCSVKVVVARSKTDHGKKLREATRSRNIETIRAYTKKIQPLRNEQEKVRSKTDPAFQLNKRMRCLMWAGLRKNKGGRKWSDLVGYSISDLHRHLEKQFKDGMTWERFLSGEIHIDHKIPRAAFNYSCAEDLDFKKCWSLKNLQPLWAQDNLSKGDKLNKPFQPSLAIGAI